MSTEGNPANKHMKHMIIGWSVMLALAIFHIVMFAIIYSAQKRLVALGEIRYQSNLLADQLRQSSDDLTRLVRTYVITKDKKFEEQFNEVLAIRDGRAPRPQNYERIYWDFLAVKDGRPPYLSGKAASLKSLMIAAGFSDREIQLLEQARINSDKLANLEQEAIQAIKKNLEAGVAHDPDADDTYKRAVDLLYGEAYHQAKINIMAPINTFMDELNSRTFEEVNRQSFRLQVFLAVLVSAFVAMVGTAILQLRLARKYHADILAQEREAASDEIKILSGMLPICACCKKIRDDKGYWSQLEHYISTHSDADFSHGYCPDCYKAVMDEIEGK